MSMQKLKGIKSVGAYTAQRSTLEHLIWLEERVLRETSEEIDIPTTKTFLTQQLKEYKTQHHLNNPFGIEDIQRYLLITTEKELGWKKSVIRGLYTSTLIEQTEGDEPITIDMLGQSISQLLYAINTPRHITINNTKGDETGAEAGSDHGQANLTINNTKGDYTGAFAGSNHGTAHLTINNTKGSFTGAIAGSNNGHVIIVAYNNKGKEQFLDHEGILVGYNPNKTQRIERVTDKQRTDILNLIAQNTPSEKIMAYLVKNT